MLSSLFRNRWIRIPLIFVVLWVGMQGTTALIFGGPVSIFPLIISGLIVGFMIEGFSWLRVRDKNGRVIPEALEVRGVRNLTLMQSADRAFETCQAAIKALPNLILREADRDQGRIVLRTKMNFHSFGTIVTIQFRQTSDHLTEVILERKPRVRTTMTDYGEGWKTVEQLVSAIKALETEPTTEVLNDGAEMINELTSRPINFSR